MPFSASCHTLSFEPVLDPNQDKVRALSPPSRIDAFKIAESGTIPPSFSLPRPCIPAEAMQPHSSQTGFPPSWHGVMELLRSAERHVVSRANSHSWGERGGFR